MTNVRGVLEKTISICVCFLFYFLLALGIHEIAHFYVARRLGVDGYITYSGWDMMGYFNYVSQPTAWQDLIIRLSGGIITAFIYFLIWYLSQRQARYTAWELDDVFSLFVTAFYQVLYAFEETWFSFGNLELTANITILLSFLLAMLIYGKRLYRWIFVLEEGNHGNRN